MTQDIKNTIKAFETSLRAATEQMVQQVIADARRVALQTAREVLTPSKAKRK